MMFFVFVASTILCVLGVMMFLKFAIEKNQLKTIGLFMILLFGLSSFYLYAKGSAEGTEWINLNKSKKVMTLIPFETESYLKEDDEHYFVLLEDSHLLKIPKENAVLANSNGQYQNQIIQETVTWLSTKADNGYSFLSKEGQIKYETYYYIYIDY